MRRPCGWSGETASRSYSNECDVRARTGTDGGNRLFSEVAVLMTAGTSSHSCPSASHQIISSLILGLVAAALTWDFPPGVNEAHYLAKARHFWDATWCAGDLFMESSEPHWLFYLTFGWLTVWLPLEWVAWVGRGLVWLVLGWGFFLFSQFDLRDASLRFAALFLALALLGNHFGNLAGEWFAGGVEAKSMAWAFVFPGLACLFWKPSESHLPPSARTEARRRATGWLLLCLATAFHVLVGGWILVLATASVLWNGYLGRRGSVAHNDDVRREHPVAPARIEWPYWIKVIVVGLVGAGLIAVGVVPALAFDGPVSAEDTLAAARIQSLGRLAHHQDALAFAPQRWVAFVGLVGYLGFFSEGLFRVNPRRSESARSFVLVGPSWRHLVVGSLILNVLGILLSLIAHGNSDAEGLAAKLLTLYWFRVADVLVPVAVAADLTRRIRQWTRDLPRPGVTSLIVVALLASFGWYGVVRFGDPRSGASRQARPLLRGADWKRLQEVDRNWQRVGRWIHENTPSDAVFLTPALQQTFKWYAERSEVVNWKDMPQDAASVVEWDRRLDAVYFGIDQRATGLAGLYNHELRSLASRYGATHMIVETRQAEWRDGIGYPLPFQAVYPPGDADFRSTFTVYRLNPIKPAEPTRSPRGD